MLEFSLLPHQEKLFLSEENTILLGGFGSGKSDAGAYKTLKKKFQHPEFKVAYYLPSYPLVRDIAFDKFTSILADNNIPYKLNRSDKEISIPNYSSIIFRTMSEPENIIGYEVAYSLIDEADILPKDKMELAFNKILGRNRAIENATIDMVSTPEGFKFLYDKVNSGLFNVIKAKTTDNKFIPKKYIEDLKEQYPEQLLKAYLNGEFVNLTQGTVYESFDRLKHNTDKVWSSKDRLLIGQDFNIGGCVSIVYIKDGSALYAVDEFVSKNTQEIINNINKKYPNNDIEIFPDASGFSGKTNATKSDNQMLIDAGFMLNAPKANGRVMDRVNATNNKFEKNELYINCAKCPGYAKALEQQTWTKNNEPEKFNGAATVDDYNDAGTYPIARLFPIVKPTVKGISISFA